MVGWDARPRVDVSNWDAVVGTKRGSEQPFVHVVADAEDTLRLFGAPRGFRYVASDNLRLLHDHDRDHPSDETRPPYQPLSPKQVACWNS